MIDFMTEAFTKWQLERLSAMILRMRNWLKRNKAEALDPALIKQHIGIAEEHFHDAVTSVKYNKFQQAFVSCQKGFIQIGMAQLISSYGDTIDGVIIKASALDKTKKFPEEQELIRYLASSLAEMKMSIEYSNFKVSDRAQKLLNSAMDFYNDAIAALKNSNTEDAKRKARAGLLQLNLSGQIISAENEESLPGWRGLSNPILSGPLRRVDELFEQIVECRTSLARLPVGKSTSVRTCYEKGMREYSAAIHSLANGSEAHAQALIRTAMHTMDEALEHANEVIAAMEENVTLEDKSTRERLSDVATNVKNIAELMETLALPKNEVAERRLHTMYQHYRDALKAMKKKRYQQAEEHANQAIAELDLLRRFLSTQLAKVEAKAREKREQHND